MLNHLRANLLLLVATVLICSVGYPFVLWAIGRAAFSDRASGSILVRNGKPVGSSLIAQPFNHDEYFQPRPSAASYNAMASSPSNLAASNYALRDRVARQLGPIVKYADGPKKGQLVAPDIEAWYQKDQIRGQKGILAQWANAHTDLATAAVKAEPLASYVAAWQKRHPEEVKKWIDAHSGPHMTVDPPKPEDMAVAFFESFGKEHPGMYPSAADHKTADGKTEKVIEPVNVGSDIQSIFFDNWLNEHRDVQLEQVPGDAVTTSGSGLDPHITLENAHWQLERVVGKWAELTGDTMENVRKKVEEAVSRNTFSPLGGLVGEPLVNVLEVNLALDATLGKSVKAK
jgi:K+-transporting ATPase ATPase C chain